MKLVQFVIQVVNQRSDVYLNPDHIVMVKKHTINPQVTELTVAGVDETLSVVENIKTVLEKLTAT